MCGSSITPASSVIGPITAAPRMEAREQLDGRVGLIGRDHRHEAAAHVEDLPHLGGGDLAEGGDQLEHRRRGQRVGDRVADPRADPAQVHQAAAGDVRQAAHVDVAERSARGSRARRSRSARAARRRPTGRRAAGRAAASSDSWPSSSSARRASVMPLEWTPEAGRPIIASPGRTVAAVDDLVELDHAERRADQVEPVRGRVAAQHLGHLADLAARDLDAGVGGADRQPAADRLEQLRARRARRRCSRAAPAARRRRRSGR